MIGAGIVIMMFVIMMWRILNSAMTSPDLFSGLICTGVMIHIAPRLSLILPLLRTLCHQPEFRFRLLVMVVHQS